MKNILICDRFTTEALIELKKNKQYNVESYKDELLASAHVLLIRSKFKIDKTILQKATNLQLIITYTSGFDHIDLVATAEKNITVAYTPEANVQAAAEHTWALIGAANRQVVNAYKEIKSGGWKLDRFFSTELCGKTLGVIGLGRIGTKVAQIAKAFGMNVVAFDPYQDIENFNLLNISRSSYEEVLKSADILTFHVPQTNETQNMFGASQIEYVHPETIVINTSRGSVVNEDDLAAALSAGKIKFAALDVFKKEPVTRENKLLKSTNVILTPHIGAYTEEAFNRSSMQAVQLVNQFYLKQTLANTLPLQNNWGSLSFSSSDSIKKNERSI
jgi:D-3-phosphoglycerate dehydrogenase / 2-oxoglutarate reductase